MTADLRPIQGPKPQSDGLREVYPNTPAYLLRPISTWTEEERRDFNAYEDAARKHAYRWDRMRGQ